MSPSPRITTAKGNTLTLTGIEVKVGSVVPDFTLSANDMSDISISAFKNKVLIISVLPSLDTPICSLQTKRFNQELDKLGDNVACLTVSLDLPFAQKRWCGAEGASKVVTASDYKYRTFGDAFGVMIKEWGLLSRAVFVVDTTGKVTYAQYVPEVSSEPDYAPVIEAVKKAAA